MTKPNLFIVGVQKGGTTTLHNVLSKSKYIFMTEIKETRFFLDYKYRIDFLDKYEFDNYKEATRNYKYVGESTPEYITSHDACDRIAQHYGKDVKIIISLRQPVERAYSQYLMYKKFNAKKFGHYVKESFETQLELEASGELDTNYIKRSSYCKDTKKYLDQFGSKNVLVLLFETEVVNKAVLFEKLSNFLGLNLA